MYLDVCMVEHDDASRKAESTTFAEPAHRLGTAVDDSFFLVCKRADSIASYNNGVVMRDNTFVIAVYRICMPDNTVANYNNAVVMPDNTVVIAISLICMPDNTVASYRNCVVGRADRVVSHHNSLARRA